MARSLGLNLQPDGFSFALLDGSAKRYTVKACGSGRLDPGAEDPARFLGKAIARALKSSPGKPDEFVATLPSLDTVLRERSLPFSERDKVHQVLKFEIEPDLYHLDIDEVVCDFIDIEDERATSTVLVAAQPKADIASALEIADEAGLEPYTIDLDVGALLSTLRMIQAAKQEEQPDLEAFLYLGPFTSTLLVMAGTSLRSVRSMRVGWREMGRGMEDQFLGEAAGESDDASAEPEASVVEVEPGEPLAEGGAGDAGTGADDAASTGPRRLFGADPDLPVGLDMDAMMVRAKPEARSAMVRRLASEVRRGLAAVASAPVTRLHLLGAAVPGLSEALQARLGIPSAELELGVEGPDGSEPDPVALGAALRGLGADGSPMNFRQEEYRVTRGLDRVEGPLTWMLVGMIAFFLVKGVILYQRTTPLKQGADTIFRTAVALVDDRLNADIEKKGYPEDWIIRTDLDTGRFDELDRIRQLLTRVKGQERDLNEYMGETGVEMPESCLEAWRLTFNALEKQLGDYDRFGRRWMLESLEFESVDPKRDAPKHVDATVGLTIFGPDATTIERKFEELQDALGSQIWSIGEAEAPGGTTDADVGSARFGKIRFKMSPSKAREAGL